MITADVQLPTYRIYTLPIFSTTFIGYLISLQLIKNRHFLSRILLGILRYINEERTEFALMFKILFRQA